MEPITHENLEEEYGTTTVFDLELMIWNCEKIKVFIRAPRDMVVKEYPYEKAARGNWTVKKWITNRLRKVIPPEVEFEIVDGYFNSNPFGKLMLRTLRDTYKSSDMS